MALAINFCYNLKDKTLKSRKLFPVNHKSWKALRKNVRTQEPTGLTASPSFPSYCNVLPFHVPCQSWLCARHKSDTQGQLNSMYLGISNWILCTECMHQDCFFEGKCPNTQVHHPAHIFSPWPPRYVKSDLHLISVVFTYLSITSFTSQVSSHWNSISSSQIIAQPPTSKLALGLFNCNQSHFALLKLHIWPGL